MRTYKIKDLVKFVVDNRGRNPSSVSELGLPIIDNFLINNNLYPDLLNVKRYLDIDYSKQFLRKPLLKDDLLITLVGNGYGNITLAPENCCIIQNTIGLRFNGICLQKYMYYKFLTMLTDFKGLNRGASQPSIKISDLLDLDIEIHEGDEQQHIVNIISSLLLKFL